MKCRFEYDAKKHDCRTQREVKEELSFPLRWYMRSSKLKIIFKELELRTWVGGESFPGPCLIPENSRGGRTE